MLPWLQLERRRSPNPSEGTIAHLFDCDRCKREQSKQTRQYMGCGYETPPADRRRVAPWDHGGRDKTGERDAKGRLHLPVCAGYVCSLPEVVEVTWAHAYWEKGELTNWCDGEVPTQALRDAIAIYAIAVSAANEWDSKNPQGKR